MSIGSGDFSLGSKVWPGTAKLLEEMGELQQILGKIIQVHGGTTHWDGDLRPRLIEELGDLGAALSFFVGGNLTADEIKAVEERIRRKAELFMKWDKEGDPPPGRSG